MAFLKPSGEFKEYLIALAMLIYLASVFARLRCHVRRQAGAAESACRAGRVISLAPRPHQQAAPALPVTRGEWVQ